MSEEPEPLVLDLETRWLAEKRGREAVPWSVEALWFLCSVSERLKRRSSQGWLMKILEAGTDARTTTPASVVAALEAVRDLGHTAESMLQLRPASPDPMSPRTHEESP